MTSLESHGMDVVSSRALCCELQEGTAGRAQMTEFLELTGLSLPLKEHPVIHRQLSSFDTHDC